LLGLQIYTMTAPADLTSGYCGFNKNSSSHD